MNAILNYRGYEIEQSEDGFFVSRVTLEYGTLEETKAAVDAEIAKHDAARVPA